MAKHVRRKPCYLLPEFSDRFGLSEQDVVNFAAENLLTLSVMVGDLPVEEGFLYEAEDFESEEDQWVREPSAEYKHTGTVDLFPEDSWRALTEGEACVKEFRANEGLYFKVDEAKKSDGFIVRSDRLLVRHEELERFESVHAIDPQSDDLTPGGRRGALPKYDWDEFWCEIAVSLQVEGMPENQAAIVRRMVDWFAARNQYPDLSTIKKKVALLWRRYREALARLPA